MKIKQVNLLDLGLKSYSEVYKLQAELVEQRIKGTINDTLIFVEHPAVVTIGRGGEDRNLLLDKKSFHERNIEVFSTNRGGDVTYHGPGQLVCYPILNLEGNGKDLHQLVRNYENTIIRMLETFGIMATQIEGLTGVWVGQEKIAAIGVGVKKWVSYHGFAINVNNDLSPFSYIVPCGIKNKGVTSMKQLLKQEVEMDDVQSRILAALTDIFQMNIIELTK